MSFRIFENPRGEIFRTGKIPAGMVKNPVITDFKPKTYRISSVGSILLEISHFSFLCQLKVLGHFAKNWFGKKIPVAV